MRWLVGVGVVVLLWPGVAWAERPFALRYAANAQGDVAIVANTILSCVSSEPACPGARNAAPGSASNNNARVMTYVDVDADAATFASSSAELRVPEGGRVLFAGLYWGARVAAGTGGAPAPDPSARGRVLLGVPGTAGYRAVSGAVDVAADVYQGFADVTDVVRAAGSGEYTVANVQAGTGRNDAQLGGWALVVAYGDPAAPPRSLAVFDGLQHVGSASAGVAIDLSGFRTPSSGAVRSRVGLVSYEGDFATTGDGATLQGAAGPVALSNAANPARNLFNSTISGGASRTPAYANQLGFDADLLATEGVLGNGQTSTRVTLTTDGDAYQPGVVTLATELFAPRIEAVKTVDRAVADLGDELVYETTIRNTGQDTATAVDFDDVLPAGVTPLPGTLLVDGVPQPDPSGGALRLADIPPGGARVVSFRVRVNDGGIATGTELANVATVAFTAADLGTRDRVESAPAVTRVRVPDLEVSKTHAPDFVVGVPSTYTIGVRNVGDAPTRGPVTVRDSLSADFTPGAVDAAGWTCGGLPELVCTRSDALAPGAEYPPIRLVVTPRIGSTTRTNTVTVSSTPDGDATNDTFTDSGEAQLAVVDLVVRKTRLTEPPQGLPAFPPAEVVEFEIEVLNKGPDVAPNVKVGDIAPASLVLDQGATGSGYPCTFGAYMECAIGDLAVGQTKTVRVVGRLADTLPEYPSDSLEENRAAASAEAGDLDYSDNLATATYRTLALTDVALTKSATPRLATAGDEVTYTLTVRNKGPAVADVFVVDTWPAELLPDPEITVAGGTGVCTFEPIFDPDASWPGCVIPQLEVGGTRTITIRARVAPGTAGRSATNVAAAGPMAVDLDYGDNRAEAAIEIGAVDLVLRKEVVGTSAGTATFRLVARNDGDRAATGVVVTDDMPDGLEPVAPLPDGCEVAGADVAARGGAVAGANVPERGGTVAGANVPERGGTVAGANVTGRGGTVADAAVAGGAAQPVVCAVGTLEPGAERAFELTLRGSGAVTNIARVRAAEAPEDVVAEAAVTIPSPPDPTPTPTPDPTPDPTPAPTPTPLAGTPPPVVPEVVCQSQRAFEIRLRERRGRVIRSARARVDGAVVPVRRRADGRWVARVDLRGKPAGTVRVDLRATLRGGRVLRWVRTYRTCVDRLPPSNRLRDRDAL